MITKKRIPWKDREHLFTPENITKYEFICTRADNCPYRKRVLKIKPRALNCGRVIWIVKGGKPVEFTFIKENKLENEMIERGQSLPDNRSGEPDQFHLEEE